MSMTRVKTILFASLRDFGPNNLREGEIIDLDLENSSATVEDLLKALKIPRNLARVVMINGERINRLDRKLHSDDTVMVFPPIGGGFCFNNIG
ncbi:MAG: MoaD/ThiS family protein [Candidatus Heimdallarchaeota archaeon]